MTQLNIVSLLRKYASSGILLDTNLLLVYIVGNFDVDRIETFKRTQTFTKNDFERLCNFVHQFAQIVTTPHILTEVSNLAGNFTGQLRTSCFESFRNDISEFCEIADTAVTIAGSPIFGRLGVTDAAIPIAAREKYLVLTDDLPLYSALCERRVEAINFNHIRPLGWTKSRR